MFTYFPPRFPTLGDCAIGFDDPPTLHAAGQILSFLSYWWESWMLGIWFFTSGVDCWIFMKHELIYMDIWGNKNHYQSSRIFFSINSYDWEALPKGFFHCVAWSKKPTTSERNELRLQNFHGWQLLYVMFRELFWFGSVLNF